MKLPQSKQVTNNYLPHELLCLEHNAVASLRTAEGLLVVTRITGWEYDLALYAYNGTPLKEYKGVQTSSAEEALYAVSL